MRRQTRTRTVERGRVGACWLLLLGSWAWAVLRFPGSFSSVFDTTENTHLTNTIDKRVKPKYRTLSLTSLIGRTTDGHAHATREK
eukprot:788282-Prymnesium_polylepis.2